MLLLWKLKQKCWDGEISGWEERGLLISKSMETGRPISRAGVRTYETIHGEEEIGLLILVILAPGF